MEVRKKPTIDLTEVQVTPGYDFSIRAIALRTGLRGWGGLACSGRRESHNLENIGVEANSKCQI